MMTSPTLTHVAVVAGIDQLPVECIAAILSWLVDDRRHGHAMTARRVSQEWRNAVAELVECRMSETDDWPREGRWAPRPRWRRWFKLTWVSLPFMSTGLLEMCRHVDLSGAKSLVTDRLVCHLAGIPELTTVNLNWCERITNSAVAVLADSLPTLTSVNLASCVALTDRALNEVAKLPCLTSLNVSWCGQITGAGVGDLARIRSLTALNLSGCQGVNWEAFCETVLSSFVACLPGLACLDLSEMTVSDNALAALSRLPSLTVLNLSGCWHLTSNGIATIQTIQGLTSLDLSWCRTVNNSVIPQLTRVPHLKTLNLAGCRDITDSGLIDLAEMTSLTSLNLYQCEKITDAGYLSPLTHLTSLNLSFCGCATDNAVTDNTLAHLSANLLNLTSIDLTASAITDVGLLRLMELPHLREVFLYNCPGITNDACWKKMSVENAEIVFHLPRKQTQVRDTPGGWTGWYRR